MSFPKVRVNTYVDKSQEISVDIISKVYVIISWVIGINRLPVIFKMRGIVFICALTYSLLLNIFSVYYVLKIHGLYDFVIDVNLIKHLMLFIFTVIYWNKLKKHYCELFQFDQEIKSDWLSKSNIISNCVQNIITIMLVVLFNIYQQKYYAGASLWPDMLLIHLNHLWEIYYYGYLFKQIELRVKSLRILLMSSFPINDQIIFCSENASVNFEDNNVINLIANNPKIKVKRLLALYYKIINIYDLLNAALQWQLLILLTATFITILSLSYHAAFNIINNEYTWQEGVFDVGMCVTMVVPLILICAYGEKIQNEVQLFQSALYSRIYKDVFDKSNRSTASSLLSLIEIRSLSFSVFRMIEINISLPFTFFGLVASYLVILLQFQKVINFDSS
ncbi:uncharacterized protein [Battus philenor]|uniref:uncharacterized protein n=1 Tax=Battus philenor TaxID=42288 RepID=UPI0035D1010C